ncbi:MAG TPA: hypothetical protein VEC16_05925 [Alphaproteobacteria bacterium]|nr:hypothetical protein [Alphaproteobacteria bacterium]
MESYFSVIDEKFYKDTVRKELSSEIIEYLSKKHGKEYISESEIEFNKLSRILFNNVTIYRRNFLGVFNTKICEISGFQRFQEWFVNDMPARLLYEPGILSKNFHPKTLSNGELEEIVSGINYKEILTKAESKRIKPKEKYESRLKIVP